MALNPSNSGNLDQLALKGLTCVTVGEEDIHAYDLSRLQKPIDQDVESVATSAKKWPDLSLTRPGQ